MAKYETSLLGRYAHGHDQHTDSYGEIVIVRESSGSIIVGIVSMLDGKIDEYETSEIDVYFDRDACTHEFQVSQIDDDQDGVS